MLENFLTLPKADFGKLLRSVSSEDTLEKAQQAYRYTQVDCSHCSSYLPYSLLCQIVQLVRNAFST